MLPSSVHRWRCDMARILILGAGLGGLATAMLLARDAHEVIVLERDRAAPPPPEDTDTAWNDWQRRGVNQFRLPHFMLPRWWQQVREQLPELGYALQAAGAQHMNLIEALPVERRGPIRRGDERFTTVTARRPVLEAVLSAAAEAAGVTIRRGVAVTGLTTDGRSRIPRVTGVLTADGTAMAGALVADCGARRSALSSWLQATGARAPVEERSDSGFVYYCRHFRSRTGEQPETLTNLLHSYDSLSAITLPGDNGTWSVVLAAASRDKALRGLREPARWHAAVARYPLLAHWADGEPISGVDVLAGIEDRCRRLVVDGDPIATGVVAVGDARACTSPSLGRGASIAVLHVITLRDVLRSISVGDHRGLVDAFAAATAERVTPLVTDTLTVDRHRRRQIDAELLGRQYAPDDPGFRFMQGLLAGAGRDPVLLR